LTVHGSGFGNDGSSHFRIVYLPEENMLEEAMDKINLFLKKAM
jgi:alanine-synthesizing transaminase